MKIAYMTSSYPPMINGVSAVVKNLAELMQKCGHSVLVITSSDRGAPYTRTVGNLRLVHVRSFHNPLRIGQRFPLYPHQTVMNALREFKPDVIHVHDPLQLGFLGAEYAKRAGIPSIVTIHAVPWLVSTNFQFAPGLASQIESILWMYAYWFVRQFPLAVTPTLTISHLIRRIVGVQPETISNGIDLQTFHPRSSSQDGNDLRKKLNIPAGVRVILHVGQLHSGKKADLVIRAAAQAMQHTNAHLLIVGDGPQKPDLIKLSKTLGISDRVHFPGYIKKEEGLPEAYRLSGVFVTASEIETQGLVLLEAAASGLPIVAVRATCIPEIVDNEINGHLADPGDVKGLGNAILEILENDPKAKTMGNASREIAEKHALQYTINAYEKLYLHLLGSRAAEKNIESLEPQYENIFKHPYAEVSPPIITTPSRASLPVKNGKDHPFGWVILQ